MREPRWDLDFGYGNDGERLVILWHHGKHEVKRKRRQDLKFYIELERCPNGQWLPGGLNESEADYYDFVIGGTGVIVTLPIHLLKYAVLVQHMGRAAEEKDGSCPTRGRLIDLRELLAALS